MPSIRSILVLLFGNIATGYLVPNPPGKYNVTLTTGSLVDYSRDDIYAATPTPRALMLSIFQPTRCPRTVPVPYMPNKTAEYQGPALAETFDITADFAPLFLGAQLPVCDQHDKQCSPMDDSPILLFSSSYSIPRLYYSVLASAIASEGFTVITIDHPSDGNIIVYPDGHAVYNNASILDSPTWDIYPRAKDASFVIDQLRNATAMAALIPKRGHRSFLTDRIAMLGHSLGGATAVVAAKEDHRIRAAVNWDGTLIGSPNVSGLSKPVLFITHNDDTAADCTWEDAWTQLDGPKSMVHIANTTHETFSDVPILLEAAGLGTASFADLLGTILPAQMVDILTTFTTTWVRGAFDDEPGKSLLPDLRQASFPEVSIETNRHFESMAPCCIDSLTGERRGTYN
jgi:dienelactone hydrolase